MNSYVEIRQRHQNEFNEFPMFFAFTNEGFQRGMEEFGLSPGDTNLLVSIGAGGFIKRSDVPAYNEMHRRHEEEINKAIKSDLTGEGFIYDMFVYELANHEYGYTYDVDDTLNALGYKFEELTSLMKKGLSLACKAVAGE